MAQLPATPGNRLGATNHILLAIAADFVVAAFAWLIAVRLRFPAYELASLWTQTLHAGGLLAACQVAGFAATGVYRSGRRFGIRVVCGAVFGTILGGATVWMVLGFDGVSRLTFPASAGLLTILVATWRSVATLIRLARLAGLQRGPDHLEDRGDAASAAAMNLVGVFGYGYLLRNLVIKDLKLKYRGSVFGFLWSLVNPLLMILVYSTAFTYILRIQVEGFVFFLLLGVLAWTFFSNSAGMSTGAIVDSGGLVRSVSFPRAILPVATVLFNLAQYLLTIVVFLPLMLLVYHVAPSPPMLLFPVFLGLQVVMTIGVALMLSAGTAFFRDVRHILEIALAVMFWTSPILYQIRDLPAQIRTPILLSPMSPFVHAYQQMFFYREWPDASLWLVALVYASGALSIGAVVFLATEDRFAEQV